MDKQKLSKFITTKLPIYELIRSNSGWNEKRLDSSLKGYKNINISGKGKYINKIKVDNIVILVCNSTFYCTKFRRCEHKNNCGSSDLYNLYTMAHSLYRLFVMSKKKKGRRGMEVYKEIHIYVCMYIYMCVCVYTYPKGTRMAILWDI